MLQLALKVRKQLASVVKDPGIKFLLEANSKKVNEVLFAMAEKLSREGHSPREIQAYQEVGPLLLEHKAISAFLENPENFEYREALPILESPREALLVAQKEYGLDPEEVSALRTLLERMLKRG